jgi:magnesium chelatase family protein
MVVRGRPKIAFRRFMIVQTLFHHDGTHRLGTVEVKLLPGIPQLHIVGLPDAAIRETGIKLKSALRSCGLAWPAGQQIVVSLRPADFKKSGAGVELAIAMAYLALSDQLAPLVAAAVGERVVYGELALNGDVFAPLDLEQALRSVGPDRLLTGHCLRQVREGRWLEIAHLCQDDPASHAREFDWGAYWVRPKPPVLDIHESAARALVLAAHMRLTALIAGPQGTGKSTWARMLHALLPPPDPAELGETARIFGDEIWESRWRPIEEPHHTLTPLAMIGGGSPLEPGVISRAHGGVLVMDEFLEFHPQVLEALREPVEHGRIELARVGQRQRFPARFQLVGTTNLCICGKLNPLGNRKCGYSLARCRSTLGRLSGPVLDRFDMMCLSHEWSGKGERWEFERMLTEVQALSDFASGRGAGAETAEDVMSEIPEWVKELPLGYRRWRSLRRVARGLADMERCGTLESRHFSQAYELVVTPMQKLREVFA